MLFFNESFVIASWFNTTVKAYWKHLLSFLLMGFNVACFFTKSGESIYISSTAFQINFMTFIIQWMNVIEDNSLPSIDSRLFWYLFLNESKIYFTTSSASSLIMISMLSHFECIARSTALSIEEIKFFAFVNWIFHVSGFF